jgi:protein PsiE
MNKFINKLVGDFIGISEKFLLLGIACATIWAAAYETYHLFDTPKMELADLFLLFIYAEVLGMVAAFYKSERIPVTIPIIIAITALARMILLQTKGAEAVNIMYESLGILILSISAYIMSIKDKISLEKLTLRKE